VLIPPIEDAYATAISAALQNSADSLTCVKNKIKFFKKIIKKNIINIKKKTSKIGGIQGR
jgi:hypothetical protein